MVTDYGLDEVADCRRLCPARLVPKSQWVVFDLTVLSDPACRTRPRPRQAGCQRLIFRGIKGKLLYSGHNVNSFHLNQFAISWQKNFQGIITWPNCWFYSCYLYHSFIWIWFTFYLPLPLCLPANSYGKIANFSIIGIAVKLIFRSRNTPAEPPRGGIPWRGGLIMLNRNIKRQERLALFMTGNITGIY